MRLDFLQNFMKNASLTQIYHLRVYSTPSPIPLDQLTLFHLNIYLWTFPVYASFVVWFALVFSGLGTSSWFGKVSQRQIEWCHWTRMKNGTVFVSSSWKYNNRFCHYWKLLGTSIPCCYNVETSEYMFSWLNNLAIHLLFVFVCIGIIFHFLIT